MQIPISMQQNSNNFLDVFEMFEASQNAKGVAEVTLRNYRYHIRSIAKYLDINKPFEEVSKRDIETMVIARERLN